MKSKKIYLSLECLLIFGATPLALAAFRPQGWMYIMLWVAALLAWRWLVHHNYRFSVVWNKAAFSKVLIKWIFWRFLLVGIVLSLFTIIAIPDHFLILPRQRPQVWAMVMIFYPLLSVIPQEIIFRSFFFRRYATLFTSQPTMIVCSALAFGWVHILLLNWVAVIFGIFGGLIFANTYNKTRSIAVVCFEHALYGCFIFTLGLGYYFYHGQAVH